MPGAVYTSTPTHLLDPPFQFLQVSGFEARTECTQGTLYLRALSAECSPSPRFEHRKTGKKLESGASLLVALLSPSTHVHTKYKQN